MTLEDHAGDVVGKARKGLGVAPEQVTEAGGFTAESYAKFEQDGTYDDLPDLEKIGELLDLNPDKLATIISGWRPDFVFCLEPGSGYLGGDFFYGEDSKCRALTAEDEAAALL